MPQFTVRARATTTLFGNRDGPDPMYNRLRNPAPDASVQVTRGRAWSEELWTRTSEYLDDDLPDKAMRAFHQCFWEMYVAAALLDLGLPLVPRAMRERKNDGPDIQVGQNIWVEAIAVTAGTGPDAVPVYVSKPNVVSDTPDEELKLRLISGIHEKRAKFEAYINKGRVKATDVCIVALNAAMTSPLIINEWGQPRIVPAVMEFSQPVIVLDRRRAALSSGPMRTRPPSSRRTRVWLARACFSMTRRSRSAHAFTATSITGTRATSLGRTLCWSTTEAPRSR
jgi:hypothetical protein